MTLATTFLAAALVVPSMPPPEYDDCEVVTNCVFGRVALDWKLRLNADRTSRSLTVTVNGQSVFTQLYQSPPSFLFDPTWNAAKIVRHGQDDPNPHIVCSVNNEPFLIRLR